jgi:putative two-component system response regulator
MAQKPSGGYILVVEDDVGVNALLNDTLQSFGYRTVAAFDGVEAMEVLGRESVDLVLTDINMPRMNGFDLCHNIKKLFRNKFIPVIILTGSGSRENRIRGIEIGADEFLSKPFDTVELQARVRSLLKLKRFTDELENAEQVLFSLALTVAAKDPYTRGHCHRIAHNAVTVGQEMGLFEDELRGIQRGGYLHDIGKIAIPDIILQKQGTLSEDETRVMMDHTVRGEEICRPLQTLAAALPVIRHHHERMDGKGYPDGVAGDKIPLGARIVAAVDLLDALITDRPYRRGLPLKVAVTILNEAAANGHLDPSVTGLLARIVTQTPERLMLSLT